MSLPTRPVFATYLLGDGTPNHGYVEFTLTSSVAVISQAIIALSTVRAVLDENGRIEADLLVLDNPAVLPAGLVWSVDEKIENGNNWYVAIPTGDGSPVDLTTLYIPGLEPPDYVTAGPPIDHGSLVGLSDPDHPIGAIVGLQEALDDLNTELGLKLTVDNIVAGANVTLDTTTIPGSVIISTTGGGVVTTPLDLIYIGSVAPVGEELLWLRPEGIGDVPDVELPASWRSDFGNGYATLTEVTEGAAIKFTNPSSTNTGAAAPSNVGQSTFSIDDSVLIEIDVVVISGWARAVQTYTSFGDTLQAGESGTIRHNYLVEGTLGGGPTVQWGAIEISPGAVVTVTAMRVFNMTDNGANLYLRETVDDDWHPIISGQSTTDNNVAPGRRTTVMTDGSISVLEGELLSAFVHTGAEDTKVRNYFTGNLSNALSQWVNRGCVASASASGTASAPTPTAVLTTLRSDYGNSVSSCAINVGATPAGSGVVLTIEKGTAPTLFQWGNGRVAPYVRLRLPSALLKIKMEWTLDGTTWTEVLASSAPNAGNNSLWIGQERVAANMPVGIRVTFDNSLLAANAIYYVLEIGLLQRNLPLGYGVWPRVYDANTFRGIQTFNDGIRIPSGAAVGRVLTSDANGNGSWSTLVIPDNSSTTVELLWDAQAQRFKRNGVLLSSRTRPSDVPLYPDGRVIFDTSTDPTFDAWPTEAAIGDAWTPELSVIGTMP